MTQPDKEEPQTQPIGLVDGLDEDDRFTFGLGMVVRASARLEYVLHGLAANLLKKQRAYGEKWAADVATDHIKACNRVLRGQGSPVPLPVRDVLIADLDSCRQALDSRNPFVHCIWTFDEAESWQWYGVKANRPKGEFQLEPRGSQDLWELTAELNRLYERILVWDIQYFGEPGDPDEGEPDWVSVKRW